MKEYLLVTMDYNNKQVMVACKNERELHYVEAMLETITDYTIFTTEWANHGVSSHKKELIETFEKELIEEYEVLGLFNYDGDDGKLANTLYKLLN